MMHVLIINAYSAQNRGDAGIVVAMIGFIRQRWPGSSIAVMSSHAIANEEFYSGYGVSSTPAVWDISVSSSSVRRYWHGATNTLLALFHPNSARFSGFHRADVVFSAGGGYLYSSRRGPLGIGLLCALFHYWVGLRLKKPVIGFPQSVGPLTTILDRTIVKRVLTRVTLFFTREAGSTGLLREFGIASVVQVPDIAFTLVPPDIRSSSDTVHVGVTVLDWRFARRDAGDDDLAQYLNKMATLLGDLLTEYPELHVNIFPQVDVARDDSDVAVSERLAAIVDNRRCTVHYLAPSLAPEMLVALYSGMALFIASRMHSAIFALAASVPTIGLAYQPKTMGTFGVVGLQDYVFDIATFPVGDVSAIARALLDSRITQPKVDVGSISDDIYNTLLPLIAAR